jgi:hypothetical protein
MLFIRNLKRELKNIEMSKSIVLISIFCCLKITVFSQDKRTFPFNEFTLSINRTNLKNENTNNTIGFGIGTFHVFLSDKKINLIMGVEYNRTNQLKKRITENHLSHSTNLKYTVNSLSVPFDIRINWGDKIKLFLESGFFGDLNIRVKRSGTMHVYLPSGNNQIEFKKFEFDETVQVFAINYGFSFGIGMSIPLSKYQLTIKPEYKFGLNDFFYNGDRIVNKYYRIILGIKIL